MSAPLWPTFNAALNATSAILLLGGVVSIRARRIAVHARYMVGACLVSLAFFASYLCYHAQVGSVRFTGTGASRQVYFAILISHTVLAVAIVPLVVRTLWLGVRRRIEPHKRLARWTFPLWLYVSVSGVIVYLMLYQRG
ncbi:MAG: hypothetical protein COV75_06170 [Candidatus Omnitrophica bacterium CG11_big_fil_rev_8_21_14_0_20_63_9]|nr:MAG: hypothetical protein COV75_06170 [Candidatus Omnitrophica bacterium CG11_big_fil_rev_8_21_14_0_20_63_9]